MCDIRVSPYVLFDIMDISKLLWRFIHVVNTRLDHEVAASRAVHKLTSLAKKNARVFIHTSYLPCLPYETNTYVMFDNVYSAFNTLHEMYQKYASWTAEAHKLAVAYNVIRRDSLCESFQRFRF